MTFTFSEDLISQLSELVAARLGLHFPRERWTGLVDGVRAASRDLGFKDVRSCIQRLLSLPLTAEQIEILASHLTVGETYFFRENKSFEILEERIFPELIRSRRGAGRRLRIWSAGCCTGEEPYSVAILLDKLLPDLQDRQITITATDINPRFLQKASSGLYGEWSFRNTPAWLKERYFLRRTPGLYELLPRIREMVKLSFLNLAEDTFPSLLNGASMDVILCRNVLMYFAPEQAKKVIQNFYLSLAEGGWLIVSPSETSQALFQRFTTVKYSGGFFYRKGSGFDSPVSGSGLQLAIPGSKIETLVLSAPKVRPEAALSLEVQTPLLSEADAPKAEEPQPYLEALELHEQGCYEGVVDKLLSRVSHHPIEPNEMALYGKSVELLARAYANLGKLAEAQEWCQKAIDVDKLNSGSHYLLATILQEQGHVDAATRSLRRALYLDHDFVLAHFALANLSLQQKKLEESGKHLKNAVRLLQRFRPDEILPESDGITAGNLAEILTSLAGKPWTS